MAKCRNCNDWGFIAVRVPNTRERAWEPCYVCNLPRDTRNVPAGTRPVAEWEREWVDEGVSHAG